MSHDGNVTRWYFSDQGGKDRIIVDMMNRLEELERYKVENEARKGVTSHLKLMEQRTKPPNFIA